MNRVYSHQTHMHFTRDCTSVDVYKKHTKSSKFIEIENEKKSIEKHIKIISSVNAQIDVQ